VVGEKIYVGNHKNPFRTATAVNPDADGFSAVWKMPVTELLEIDNDNILYLTNNDVMWVIGSGYGNNANPSETMELPHYVIDFSLCYQNCILNITSTDTFNADEGTSVNNTLVLLLV
jgi:hypothetical protein